MLWEELTCKDFTAAVETSKKVCVLPMGCVEKHGDHLPLGTDMYSVREVAEKAAEKEPVVVFPYYPFGQISEACHVKGTIALKMDTLVTLLDEICDEIHRNGFEKIILLNFHGGSPDYLRYFCLSGLSEKKEYVKYFIPGPAGTTEAQYKEYRELLGTNDLGPHGGALETSIMLATCPELVKMDQIKAEESVNLKRLNHLSKMGIYTGISWYASFPHHFAGDPTPAKAEVGQMWLNERIDYFAKMFKLIKEDTVSPALQEEFFALSGL